MSKSSTYRGSQRNDLDNVDLDDPKTRGQTDPRLALDPEAEPVDPLTGNPKELTAEEDTYKTRYGDLRRHQQKTETELKSEIDKLKTEIRDLSKKEFKLPGDETEYQEWSKAYPQLKTIVERIALEKALELNKDLDVRLEQTENLRRQAATERAENLIRKAHPEFDDYKTDTKFHKWAESQPKSIRNMLYENDDDPDAVIRAIDLYKADTRVTSEKPQDNRSAALAVKPRKEQNVPTGENPADTDKIKESWIRGLTSREFEKNYDMIIEKQKAGKLIYDITGAAR